MIGVSDKFPVPYFRKNRLIDKLLSIASPEIDQNAHRQTMLYL